jgi:hypothetical protein
MWCGRHQSCPDEVDDDGYKTILSLLGLQIQYRGGLCTEHCVVIRPWLPCPCLSSVSAKWGHWSARSSTVVNLQLQLQLQLQGG